MMTSYFRNSGKEALNYLNVLDVKLLLYSNETEKPSINDLNPRRTNVFCAH